MDDRAATLRGAIAAQLGGTAISPIWGIVEDLGIVPEDFRDVLALWGLWGGCRVMLFEREYDGDFRAPAQYPAQTLPSFNTHDWPSFRSWMEGHDLRVRKAIGAALGESDEARAKSQAAPRKALARWAPAYDPDGVAAPVAFLGATPVPVGSDRARRHSGRA